MYRRGCVFCWFLRRWSILTDVLMTPDGRCGGAPSRSRRCFSPFANSKITGASLILAVLAHLAKKYRAPS